MKSRRLTMRSTIMRALIGYTLIGALVLVVRVL